MSPVKADSPKETNRPNKRKSSDFNIEPGEQDTSYPPKPDDSAVSEYNKRQALTIGEIKQMLEEHAEQNTEVRLTPQQVEKILDSLSSNKPVRGIVANTYTPDYVEKEVSRFNSPFNTANTSEEKDNSAGDAAYPSKNQIVQTSILISVGSLAIGGLVLWALVSGAIPPIIASVALAILIIVATISSVTGYKLANAVSS